MSAHLTEEQQLDALKKWWKEYGLSIVLGVVIALLLGFGWRFYQKHKVHRAQHASLVYSQVIADLDAGQLKQAKQQAHVLRMHFSGTPYATLSAFILAQHAVLAGRLTEAVDYLHWATEHSNVKLFRQIARIRLARVYVAQHQAKKALALLADTEHSAFDGLVEEVRGDAYVSLDNISKAKEAYQSALQKLPSGAISRPLLEMKLHNL